MSRITNVAVVSLGLLLGTAGCNDFLTGNKLSSNPNQPSSASISQLFVAVQAGQFALQEGTVPMMMCMWVQACGGTNARFVEQAGRYVFGESSNIGANGGDWAVVYDAGGLVDIRAVVADATAAGDSTWLGIAKVWEALTIGTASDMWGDVPFTEVTTSATPALDARFAVLDSVQSLLSQAIAELTNGAGDGPGAVDLVFGGDRPSWIKAAWTLKARYLMHTAESLGTPAYTAAIAAALQGISDATGAGDLAGFHSGSGAGERNMWAAFQSSSSFGQDVVAGKALVDIMNGRSDPRLPAYFCLNTVGAYAGQDFNTPVADVSAFGCKPLRFSDTYRMPYVSYAENELILAEAYNQTLDDANALLHLNNARAFVERDLSTHGRSASHGGLAGAGGDYRRRVARLDHDREVHHHVPEHRDDQRLPAHVHSGDHRGRQQPGLQQRAGAPVLSPDRAQRESEYSGSLRAARSPLVLPQPGGRARLYPGHLAVRPGS